MYKHIRANERGSTLLPWLRSYHSFSFNRYYDPARMGFGPLRVVNQDWVAPGGGFSSHSHRDALIISLVTHGEMVHRDTAGHEQRLRSGDYQYMSAGSGIRHSEFNASDTEPMEFVQIWVTPRHKNTAPVYQVRHFDDAAMLQPIAAGEADVGVDTGVFLLDQDIRIWQLQLNAGEHIQQNLPDQWQRRVQLVKGEITLENTRLQPGDALEFGPDLYPNQVTTYRANSNSLALIFDIPANNQPRTTP
ncbi:MAG: pirin family protein [Porticoccus sp.]|uniref:pirin family protein n=1 Tax=Porticoccus sp. TaxID=2024853 RepID=UPI00329856C5